jgi:hypothetical protein
MNKIHLNTDKVRNGRIGTYKISFYVGDKIYVYVGSTKCFMTRWFNHIDGFNSGKHFNYRIKNIIESGKCEYIEFDVISTWVDYSSALCEEYKIINELDSSIRLNILLYPHEKELKILRTYRTEEQKCLTKIRK